MRSGRRTHRIGETFTGWAFVAPALVVVLGLSIFPAAWAFLLSLQDWNGFSEPTFVGAENYADLLTDEALFESLQHTALYTVLFVPTSLLAGLWLAVALNRRIRFISFYRTAIFVPFVASAAATGILSNYLFNPQFGFANQLLTSVGLPAQGWLEDPNQAMFVIALMSLWGNAAFTTVLYLAALQDISPDLLEAARIDGASKRQAFWYVTWPQLGPVTVFTGIWQAIQAIQLFDLVYTTTRGGPLSATTTVVYYLWEAAFKSLDFGYGSAVAYGLFALTLVFTIGVFIYARRARVSAF